MKLSIRIAFAVVPAVLAVAALWIATRGRAGEAVTSAGSSVPELDSASGGRDPSRAEAQPESAAGARTEAAPTPGKPVESTPFLALVVKTERGTPVESAKLLVLDGRNEIQESTTDDAGRARFVASGGPAQLFVARPSHAPQRVEIELSAGEREITLLDGASVSGVVTVGGERPSKPLTLPLRSDRTPFAGLELPAAVHEALGTAKELEATTDARGAFAFGGLEQDWSGQLRWTRGFRLSDQASTGFGNRTIALERPVGGLRIDLVRLPHLVGRVVDTEGRPAAELRVVATFEWADGGGMVTSVATDADGRFEIAVKLDGFRRVELSADTESARIRRSFQREQIGDDLDLGTLVLEPPLSLRFRAVNAEGSPTEARGRIVGESGWHATGASGEATVNAAEAGPARLRVVAKGFWAAEVPVLVPSEDVVTVELERCNRLDLTVVADHGRPAGRTELNVSCTGAPLFPDNGRWYVDDTMLGIVVGDEAGGGQEVDRDGDPGNDRGWTTVRANAEGRAALQGLVPGRMLRVSAVDATGRELTAVDVPPLGRDEVRGVSIPIGSMQTIAGRVLDEARAPLDGVSIYVRASGGDESAYIRSNPDGRFELSGISSDRVQVSAERPGYAVALLRDVRPSDGLEIVLRRGRKVAIEVSDRLGRPFPIEAHVIGVSTETERLKANGPRGSSERQELIDLPPELVRIRLDLAGRTYEVDNLPGEDVARIVVEVHGKLVVSCAKLGDTLENPCVVQLQPLDPAVKARSCQVADGRADFGDTLPGEYDITLVRLRPGESPEPIVETKRARVEADATAAVELP